MVTKEAPVGLMKRLSSIFQAKSNAALNKMEDPRQTLDLSYEQQLDNLTKVRRAIADVATARKRVEIQAEQLKNQGDKLADQAKPAMAPYTAAEASARISEAVSGISTSMGDAGAAMQRAQDKVAAMQARSGALDELLASGQLTDLTSTSDDIQAQLDKAGGSGNVDAQIAALKAQVAAPAASELPSGETK